MTATAPAKAPPKTNRATWLDWQRVAVPEAPEPRELLTREEFVDRLNGIGLDIDVDSNLRYWERKGILPRAIRRGDGVTRTSRSYYPPWMIGLVILLRELQADGLSLPEIAQRLRAEAPRVINRSWSADLVGGTEAYWQLPVIPPDLESVLLNYIKRCQYAMGGKRLRSFAVVVDENDKEVSRYGTGLLDSN
jgi:DNA-binding transcriptional MerR regulator